MATTAKYQRWVSLGFVGMATITYMIIGSAAAMIWDLARLSYPKGWPFTPPELIGMASAVICFLILRKRQEINLFMNEAAGELAKVTWPPRKETVMSTGVIAIVVGFCAILLAVFDVIWGWGVKVIY